MKTALKLIFMTLPLVLAGVAFLIYTVANKPPPEQISLDERSTAVRIIIAQNYAIAPVATGFGLVEPARTYDAIAQVSGTADYVNPLLKKGAILPAGAVLLRLSPADFNLAIAQARANIRAAEAKLAEITISETNQTAALALEYEALEIKTGDLERVERLFDNGTVSQASLDNSRATHLAQRQKVLNLENALNLLPTQRAVQTEQIAVYKASLETATLNLARTELTLPFTARVASVVVESGQFVRSGLTIAKLDGVAAAEIAAQISVADLRALLRTTGSQSSAVGMNPSAMNAILQGFDLTATVSMDLGAQTLDWPATVDRISDSIDIKTGNIGVIVRVANAYKAASAGDRPPLTKGMFVKVTLGAHPVDGIIIPRSALRAGQVMLVGDDNRLLLHDIKPYLVQGDIAVIREGLPVGSRIVVSKPAVVMTGLLLDPREDTALMAALAAGTTDTDTNAGSDK